MRTRRAGHTLPMLRLALCLVIVAIARPVPALAAGGVEVSSDGVAAWLLRGDSSLERIDLATGTGSVLEAPPGIVAIAVPGEARVLYAIAPAPDGKSTALLALSPDTGEEVSRRELKGAGRMLAVTTDGSFVCVAGQRPGGRGPGGGDWTLTVIDVFSGKVAGPMLLGIEPLSMTLRDEAGAGRAGARLLLATYDRVATYLLDPPTSSWFYRSPGENREIDAIDRSPLVCLLRGDDLVLVDPRRRQRESGRVQLGEDDATSVIHLATPGASATLTPDGSTVAVLRPGGAGLAFYDTLDGALLGTRALDTMPDLLARRMPVDPDRRARIVVASSLRGVVSVIDHPLPPPRPEPEPATPRAAPEIVAPPPEAAPEQPPPSPAPAPQAPRPEPAEVPAAPPAPAPEPPGRPGSEAPAMPSSPADEPTPPREPAPESAPQNAPEPGPTRASADGRLTGRVTGAAGLAGAVLLYGPDNILKLGARAAIAADGTFSFPLPAPGTYRLLVSGDKDAYLFTSPQYRTVVVTPEQVTEGRGIEGIDFLVRGSL